MRVVYPIGTVMESFVRGEVRIEETRLRSILKVAELFAEHTDTYVYFVVWVNMFSGQERVEIRPHPRLANVAYVLSYRRMYRRGALPSDHVNVTDMRVLTTLFHTTHGRWPVDCMLVPDLYYVGGATMATEYTGRHYRLPVFARLTLGPNETDKSLNKRTFYTPEDVMCMDYAARALMTAPHQYKLLSGRMKDMLSFSYQRELQERFEYWPHGVSVPAAVPSVQGRPRVVGHFGRLNEGNRKFRQVVDVYGKLYGLGLIERAVFTMPSTPVDTPEVEQAFIDVRIRGYEYVEEAAGIRAAMYNAVGMAFPITLVEMAARGVVPLVRSDKLWSTMLFPKDYPWRYGSSEEALALLKVLMTDDAEYEKWAQWCIDWVRSNFDVRETKRALAERMRDVVAGERTKNPMGPCDTEPLDVLRKKCGFVEGIEQVAASLGDEFTWDEFAEKVYAKGVPVLYQGRPLVSLHGMKRVLGLLGYEDTMDSHDIRLRRRHV